LSIFGRGFNAWISNHIDCFDSQARLNESIKEVIVYPYSVDGQDDEVWDKIGQAIGNLQALKRLNLDYNSEYRDRNHDEDSPAVDWEIVARILSQMRQKIAVNITDVLAWDVEESRLFTRAIHGHPTITRFENGESFPYESLGALYSVLAALPALESIRLVSCHTRPEDESDLAHPKSLTELLRVPSLRSVLFYRFHFTRALCQATANALIEGTVISNLVFCYCSFSAGECTAMMTKGLMINTSVVSITVQCDNARVLFGALAAILPLNSTLRHLDLGWQDTDGPDCLTSVFSALGQNTGLKTLVVGVSCSMNESLSAAMQDGLGMNETLESLELNRVPLCDDTADVWCKALSFLRTNKILKSLIIRLKDVTKSCVAALCRHIASMLQENVSLESLAIRSMNKINAEDYLNFISALQDNTTLKTFSLNRFHYEMLPSTDDEIKLQLTDDEDKQIASLLKNNFGLECLPSLDREAGEVGAALRLNGAGRRYLIEDGSSISKGVKVLSRVNNDINCVFLHLLENPRLCDRSAVEIVSAGESNDSLTNPTAGSDGGKRERASVHKGRVSHRRLA
jgi:hypothetical protein